MLSHHRARLYIFAAVVLALCACQEEGIRSYSVGTGLRSQQVGLDAVREPTLSVEGRGSGLPGELTWEVPEGWVITEGNPMRVGSFQFGTADNRAEISVVPLLGDGGGLLANINLWRSQLGLAELEDSADSAAEVDIGENRVTLVELTGDNQMKIADARQAIVVAIMNRNTESWFFKMAGSVAAIQAGRESFMHFLASVKFNAR